MKYKTIYADPPWPERGGGKVPRGANRHYSLMTLEEIGALPVAEYAEPDCHLYLWTTNTFLPDAIDVLKAWGFRYITLITWAKSRIGLGHYFRGQTEHCLFGVRGNLPYRLFDGRIQQGRTLILESAPFSLFRCHSTKPPEMRAMIERVSYPPRLQLFARHTAAGWNSIGDQLKIVNNFAGAEPCEEQQ